MARRTLILIAMTLAALGASIGFVSLASGSTHSGAGVSNTTVDPSQATLPGPDDISGAPSPHAYLYECLQPTSTCTDTEKAESEQAATTPVTRAAAQDPHAVSESDAEALVKASSSIDRLDRIDVRTTTWSDFYNATAWSKHTRGDEGIDPNAVVRVVAVGGAVHVPTGFVPTKYNWMVVVLDADTGEHYATTMGNSENEWPPYFDGLPPAS